MASTRIVDVDGRYGWDTAVQLTCHAVVLGLRLLTLTLQDERQATRKWADRKYTL